MTELLTDKRTELAHRSSGGLDVTLLWQGDDNVIICVCDAREGAYFEIPAEPSLALEVYYHPFAYRDFSTVEYADSRLAARSMIEIGTYRRRRDAERAQATLAAVGIPTIVAGGHADGLYQSDFGVGARLLVDEGDAEEANAALSKRPHANEKGNR